jgi:hypothetical protein
MPQKHDARPAAGGDGTGDHCQDFELFPAFDFTSSTATVNCPPLSPLLRDLAERTGLKSLCPFLAHLPVEDQDRVLDFFAVLRAGGWRKLKIARREARRLIRAGARIGGDTLPPLLVPHGYPRRNNITRALLVAAVVCAWPEEFRGRVTLRDRAAKDLIKTGWRPDLPTRRRGRKG